MPLRRETVSHDHIVKAKGDACDLLTGCRYDVAMLRPRYGRKFPATNVDYDSDVSFGVVPMRMRDGEREFLIVLHNKGHWAFPKGHAEKGEKPIETACREFTEETGLGIERLYGEHAFVEHYEFEKSNGKAVRKTVTYYLADVADGEVEVQADEVADFFWGNAKDTRAKITFGESRQLFDQVLKYLEGL